MSNSLLTPVALTREFLRIFHNSIAFAKNVNRQYDSQFAKSGATTSGKTGPELRVRKPNRFTVREDAVLNVQDVVEQYATVSCTTQKGVDMQFSSADLTLTIDEFSDRYIRPAALALASTIDYEGLSLYRDIANQVGVPGTTPGKGAAGSGADVPAVFLDAGALLTDCTAPKDDRTVVLSPAAMAATVGGLSGLFNAQQSIADQYKKGSMGYALGFEFLEDQNINRLTTGTRAKSTPTFASISAAGSVVTLTVTTGKNVTRGEIFTIAGVNGVNPETKRSTGALQQFVVTGDATSGSGTSITVSIYPPMIADAGVTKTVTKLPSAGDTIVFAGESATDYPVGLAFHKDAFTLVTADLVLPKGVDFAAQEVYDGISVRVVRMYDINNDTFPCRIDVLYGWKTLIPEFACRIIG
jgi:hypothetical protein